MEELNIKNLEGMVEGNVFGSLKTTLGLFKRSRASITNRISHRPVGDHLLKVTRQISLPERFTRTKLSQQLIDLLIYWVVASISIENLESSID